MTGSKDDQEPMTFSDAELQLLVREVTEALVDGKKHQTTGFGTFSTCTRKAKPDRPACKIAMFRASPQLREYASGGPAPVVTGPHAKTLNLIISAMRNEHGADVPGLGRLAVVPGEKPKLIFHAARQLNDLLIV